MQKEIMGNQNTTAIPEDSKVVDDSAESSGQANISPDDKRGGDQVSSLPKYTHEVSADEPPHQQSQASVHATEQSTNEQVQPSGEHHDQLEVNDEGRHEIEPQNDDQTLANPSFKDNDVGIDSNLDQKCVSQESEAVEYKHQDMFNNQPLPGSTEELQTKASHSEVGSNLEEDQKIQKEPTDAIEDVCDPQDHDLVDRKCDFGPEPGMVGTNDHSTDSEARFNQRNGNRTELTSCHSMIENGQFLEDGQACTGDRTTEYAEEKADQSIVEQPTVLSHDNPVQDDMIAFAGESRTIINDKSLAEEIEDELIPLNRLHVASEYEWKIDKIQACEQRHEILSNGHDQEFIKVKQVQVDDIKDLSNATGNFTSLISNGQENHGDMHQMLEESTSVFKESIKSRQACDEKHEDNDQICEGVSKVHDLEIISTNKGNSDDFAGKPEAHTGGIKCMTNNFTSLNTSGPGNNAKPIMSNGFKDKDKLSDKDNVAQIQPRRENYISTQASELVYAKPDIEGFIFTSESIIEGQPTTGYLLSGTVTNFIELPEEKGREDDVMVENPIGESQVQRCPSFKFELKKETHQEEFNQTPILYQAKPPMRSLSSPGNIFLSAFTESHQNSYNFVDLSVKENTIILERNDSEKSRAPLLRFKKDEEGNCFSTIRHQKPVEEMSNGHSKREATHLSKGRRKQKTMSSFFSNCVCCAGVGELNADF